MKRSAIAILAALSLHGQMGDPRQAPWIRLSTSDFELFSTAPEKEARDLLKSFEQIRGFFQKASPVPLVEDFPVRIVAFSSIEQFSFFAPSGGVVAYFAAGPRTDYIVMKDATPASYAFGIHEYMHLLIRHSGLRIPVWLNEGWSDVYSTLRPVHDGVAVGDLIPVRVKTLEVEPWLPLEALTSVSSDSRLINESTRVGMFYAESWALTHMLFLSPEYANGFPKFLTAINHGKTTDEAFQSTWGKSSSQLFADLQAYMKRRKMAGRVFEVPLGKAALPVEVTKLDSFDARLMLVDLTIAQTRKSEAKRELEALAALRPNNMLVNESLGFAAFSVKELEEARVNFEKAFDAGDANPLMCFRLALLEGNAHQPVEKIMAPLERAVQAKPDYVDAQLQLGVLHVTLRQFPQAITTLMGIKKITPERATAVYSMLAYSYLQTGELDKARADAATAKEWASDTRQVSTEDQLIGMIDARAKSPFAPRPGEKTERVQGTLKAVDCSQGSRLVITTADKVLMLDLPDLKSIEFAHAGEQKSIKLGCGPVEPVKVTIDYAPASVMKAGPAGVIRRIEY